MTKITKADDYISTEGAPTVGQLKEVLKHFKDEDELKVVVLNADFNVVPFKFSPVALASDQEGSLVVGIFPGSIDEWRTHKDTLA